MSALAFIIACPLLMAVLIAFIPRNYRYLFRLLALLATFLSAVVALAVFCRFQPGYAGVQFERRFDWVRALGISLHLGVDGLNVALVFMGAVVAFAAACVSREIKDREKEYYCLLLLMTGGILGAFASLDIFFFYFFHEVALVPTFIMVGVWGRGPNRDYAAFKLTLYLSLGALLALLGLIALYVQTGARTFDILELTRQVAARPIAPPAQSVIFGLLLFGFGILISLWPFHTWAPLGYSAAPTATAMLHAGVLKKFGLYGLIRVAVPLLPTGAQSWAHILAFLCLGNLLYCGLVAIRQKDLNLLIGNSSVAHMGFAFLGIASLSLIGVTGAVVVMVAHGFLAALTFALSGYLYSQTGTLMMDQLGGLLRRLPFIGACLIMALFAGCGLPGFANFPGELLVFFGAWANYTLLVVLAVYAAAVVGAVYMLRAVRNLMHGPLAAKGASIADADGPWQKLPYAILLGALVVFGCFPRLLIDRIKPDVANVANAIAVSVGERPLAHASRAPTAAPTVAARRLRHEIDSDARRTASPNSGPSSPAPTAALP